jgi:hypothetical protein
MGVTLRRRQHVHFSNANSAIPSIIILLETYSIQNNKQISIAKASTESDLSCSLPVKACGKIYDSRGSNIHAQIETRKTPTERNTTVRLKI